MWERAPNRYTIRAHSHPGSISNLLPQDRRCDRSGRKQNSRAFRAYIAGDSIQELVDTIHKVQEAIVIQDTDGRNVIYGPADLSFMTNYQYKPAQPFAGHSTGERR